MKERPLKYFIKLFFTRKAVLNVSVPEAAEAECDC